MKSIFPLTVFFIAFTSQIFCQSVCDLFITSSRTTNHEITKKRTSRLIFQNSNDARPNIIEKDSLGHLRFRGNIGSLQVETYEADGREYAKIQSEYLKEDEWTWTELSPNESHLNSWFDLSSRELQMVGCQVIGEEQIGLHKCHIIGYTVHKLVSKDNDVDFFIMKMNVKTWFCREDNQVYKSTYEMTNDRFAERQNAVIEYDVPINIEIPKNAKYQSPRLSTLSTLNDRMFTQLVSDTLPRKNKPTEMDGEIKNGLLNSGKQ